MYTNTAEYTEFVTKQWNHSDPESQLGLRDLFIMSTGLPGETGEVCEHLKKYIRDNKLDKDALKKELGDALYYLTRIAAWFGFTLDEIMHTNYTKLMDRRVRGVVHGSGDNR